MDLTLDVSNYINIILTTFVDVFIMLKVVLGDALIPMGFGACLFF